MNRSEKPFSASPVKDRRLHGLTPSFPSKEPCHFIAQPADLPWQTGGRWESSSWGQIKHLRMDFRPNQTDLIIFSTLYSKQHVTYFRPHSELTIINCNLYRFQFNTWTGLLKKKKIKKKAGQFPKLKKVRNSFLSSNVRQKHIVYWLYIIIFPTQFQGKYFRGFYGVSNLAQGQNMISYTEKLNFPLIKMQLIFAFLAEMEAYISEFGWVWDLLLWHKAQLCLGSNEISNSGETCPYFPSPILSCFITQENTISSLPLHCHPQCHTKSQQWK